MVLNAKNLRVPWMNDRLALSTSRPCPARNRQVIPKPLRPAFGASDTPGATDPSSSPRLGEPPAPLLQPADLLVCDRCGGPRRVLAAVTEPCAVRRVLEHMRLPSQPLPIAPAQGPPQLDWVA